VVAAPLRLLFHFILFFFNYFFYLIFSPWNFLPLNPLHLTNQSLIFIFYFYLKGPGHEIFYFNFCAHFFSSGALISFRNSVLQINSNLRQKSKLKKRPRSINTARKNFRAVLIQRRMTSARY